MMTDHRADPDRLLKKIRMEDNQPGRGKLKIFFGYAAGVGKTYAMLQTARELKERGVDVVCGYVELHDRPETLELMEGLECIAHRPAPHSTRGEFDLDAALKRAPDVLLVDELAHTNAEGSRHAKRSADVKELLAAGINVITTVNVQHLESLNDIVAGITGVTVRERIPDELFDRADQVELVDIEPEELIQRFREGKVYNGEQAERALQSFFTLHNLVALREIALRRTADRVNRISESTRNGSDEFYTEEHILVCLSPAPTNPRIIRTAARMADAFQGKLTALYIGSLDDPDLTEADKKALGENIRLAESLGAETESIQGDDIAFQIAEYARLSGVSKIVLGRSQSHSGRWHFHSGTLTERIAECAPNMDVYIIPERTDRKIVKTKHKQGNWWSTKDLIISILVLMLASVVGWGFYELGFSNTNIIVVYILGVLVTAMLTEHRAYSLAASVASVLVFNFLFTEPRFTFNTYESGYQTTYVIVMITALLSSSLVVRVKRQAELSAKTAYRTRILFDASQLIGAQKDSAKIAEVSCIQLSKLLGRPVVYYNLENGLLGEPVQYGDGTPDQELATENEKGVAAWAAKNNKRAGATTDTLGSAKCLYLSIRVGDEVFGVAGVAARNDPLEPFEYSTMLSILGECALALKNVKAVKEREEAAAAAKNEKMRANLLRSISHDLRTPLTSISGSAGILLNDMSDLNGPQQRELLSDIYNDSLWLIDLVENLLSVTRLESGPSALSFTTELEEELITEALSHINKRTAHHHIIFEPPEDLCFVQVDARMFMQVVVNLVDNAVKYTPDGSDIRLRVKKSGENTVMTVSDFGPGIPDEQKEKVFDLYYTGESASADSRRGVGLGLALCRTILTAHNGTITVSDNVPQGAVFTVTLPCKEVDVHE